MNLNDFRIEVYPLLEPCRSGWLDLESRNLLATPFQSYHWVSAWYQFILPDNFVDLKIVEVKAKKDDTTVMIIPLAVYRKSLFKRLSWAAEFVSDYQAPLFDPRYVNQVLFDQIWQEVISHLHGADYIDLNNMAPSHEGTICLSSQDTKENFYRSHLPSSWEDFSKTIDKKVRNNLRRRKKKLAELGNLEFKVVEDNKEQASLIDYVIAKKIDKFAGTDIGRFFQKPGATQFFHALIDTPFEAYTSLSKVALDGKILAAHWGLHHKNKLYHMLPCHEIGEWKKYGTGVILLEELFQWAIEQGCQCFDFTVGAEEYKKHWVNTVVPVHRHLDHKTLIGPFATGLIRWRMTKDDHHKMVVLLRKVVG